MGIEVVAKGCDAVTGVDAEGSLLMRVEFLLVINILETGWRADIQLGQADRTVEARPS